MAKIERNPDGSVYSVQLDAGSFSSTEDIKHEIRQLKEIKKIWDKKLRSLTTVTTVADAIGAKKPFNSEGDICDAKTIIWQCSGLIYELQKALKKKGKI